MEDKSIIIMYSWLNNEYVPLNEEEQRELLWAIYKYSIGEEYNIPETQRLVRSNFGQILPQIKRIQTSHERNINGGKKTQTVKDINGNRIKADQKRVWQLMQEHPGNYAEVQRIYSREIGLPEGVLIPKGQIYDGAARAHENDPGWGLEKEDIVSSGEIKKNSGNSSFNF